MSQFIEMVGDPRNNPKGWPTKRLSELAEYSIGLTYKPEQICDDGTIVLRSGNIQDGKISFSDIVRVNAPIKESLFVKEDDILMCSRNGSASLVGKVAMIPDINEPMTFGAFMTIIRSAEAKYLYLYFQSQDFRERVSEGKSSTMNQITQKMLDKVEVPFPDKDVRETLSAIASQADKSKFGDFKSQFIEMVGDPRNNPKGWPTKRLSELAEYSIGLTYKPEQICDDGTIVLRSGNIQDGKISFSDIVRVNAPIKESLFVKEDDILMCSRNGSASLVGKVAMIPDINEPMTFGAFMTIIRSAEAKYLYLYFQSQDFRERVSEGKSSTMNQITQKMLDKVEVPFPDKDVRETLSAIASQADKSKSVIQKALVYLNDIQSDELRKIA